MIHKGRRKSRSPIVATLDFNNQTSQSKHLKEAEWKAQSLPRFAPPLCSFPCGPNQYSNLWGLDCFALIGWSFADLGKLCARWCAQNGKTNRRPLQNAHNTVCVRDCEDEEERWIWSRSNQIRCTSQQPQSSFRVNKWRLGFFFQRGGFETLEVISPLHATCNYAEPSPREVCGNWEIVVAKKALKRWSILKRCALFLFFARKLQHSTPTEQLITQRS